MTLHDIEKAITKYLKDHFIERGNKDFYFKSNKLELPIDNRVKGRVLRNHIAKKGIIELWSSDSNNHNLVWKTCFNGVP